MLSNQIFKSVYLESLMYRENFIGESLSVFALCGALYFIVRLLVTRYLHLNTIPGPTWAPFTRLWLLRTLASEDSANTYVRVNRKYGPLARIGPNHLLLSDPNAIRRILANSTKYTRGPWYDALRIDPHRANLITERDELKHRVLRHQMAAGYAGNDIASLEPSINERIEEWISYIGHNALSDACNTIKFDMGRSSQYLTTDIISHLCFGEPFGFVKSHTDVYGFIYTLESRLPIVENFSVLVELNTLLSWISYIPSIKQFLLPQPTDADGLGKIIGISRKVLNERYAPSPTIKDDILGSFLKHGVPREQAESEITISLFAGSDTTASSLRGTILHVATCPRVYARLREEIFDASASNRISTPISNQEAMALPYLQACIKEGMRIFPPITSLRERVVPAGGDTILGYFVPANTNIGINMPGMLLDDVFGPDADVFRPERWFEKDTNKLAEMKRVQELVFGYGGTRCLGIRIANMTLNKAIVEIMRNYDIAITNPTSPWKSRCHGIFFQQDFWMRITRLGFFRRQGEEYNCIVMRLLEADIGN